MVGVCMGIPDEERGAEAGVGRSESPLQVFLHTGRTNSGLAGDGLSGFRPVRLRD